MENFKVRKLVDKFFREEAPKIVLYNEAGLQHELAVFPSNPPQNVSTSRLFAPLFNSKNDQ
jgi:hypothetical protein